MRMVWKIYKKYKVIRKSCNLLKSSRQYSQPFCWTVTLSQIGNFKIYIIIFASYIIIIVDDKGQFHHINLKQVKLLNGLWHIKNYSATIFCRIDKCKFERFTKQFRITHHHKNLENSSRDSNAYDIRAPKLSHSPDCFTSVNARYHVWNRICFN